MDRGIRATTQGLEQVKTAIQVKGWTQDYLAGISRCSRQTVNSFLARKKIEKRIFQDICNELQLEWGEIAELETDPEINSPLNVDELVQKIRVDIRGTVQNKCGSMRILDMTQPIDLNAIYTNVNILEKITSRQRLEYEDLLKICSSEDFDRVSLSSVKAPRIPALNAVNKYDKLMILGKPGSGKTTFLKYVALQCIEGRFKSNLIPLFITLKDFVEIDGKPNLLEYTTKIFKDLGIDKGINIQKTLWDSLFDSHSAPVEYLIKQGKCLFLLDGLDEIKEEESKRVIREISSFSNRFDKNIFAITCRIAAKEYSLDKFVEVEVADFDESQVRTFVQGWFAAKDDITKANNFVDKLQENKPIRELASSPLLLTLLCLVFGEIGHFPKNRADLYQEGLDELLIKWDAKRNIERDRFYKNMSRKHKENLLSQIARETFEKETYFFKQKEAEKHILKYIYNLEDANTQVDELQLDSQAVLKSIEAQHGLLVERAREIYSFSHLTFHEYFTAREFTNSANSDILVQKLAAHVAEKRWREVFLLTCEMLPTADLLLQAMKQEIDSILDRDAYLQKFLTWVSQKSGSTENLYKPADIREYYFNFPLNISQKKLRERPLEPGIALDLTLNFIFTSLDRFENPVLDINALNLAIDRADNFLELKQLLHQIRNELPDDEYQRDRVYFSQWWQDHGQSWTEKLRKIAIEHRNIGHKWQFSFRQTELVQKYYNANMLLLECLKSNCYLDLKIRSKIESNLWLPLNQINSNR